MADDLTDIEEMMGAARSAGGVAKDILMRSAAEALRRYAQPRGIYGTPMRAHALIDELRREGYPLHPQPSPRRPSIIGRPPYPYKSPLL